MAFRAARAGDSLTCEPGYVYGISATGQLQQVTNGSVTNIGRSDFAALILQVTNRQHTDRASTVDDNLLATHW